MNILQPPLKIVQYPNPSLRHKAVPLTHIDDEVRHAAFAMLDLMYTHKGLGLAGPQVGLPFQMFVCNFAGDPEQKEAEGVFLNPVILDKEGTQEDEEGCLSFPKLYQKVRRAKSVKVQAYNLKGEPIELKAVDLPARILQHEHDHLHGVLFIDKFGPIGKLAARATLREFEYLHKRAQEKGELPPDVEIEKRLKELEAEA
jgi:peptide deformylase